mmetsp:Transcript_26629/g.95018  ORF Transcript_26629/g.95018 Transcript_26629/m.95018 type:complete len:209 (+) Transcript_26629:784-1410(+)
MSAGSHSSTGKGSKSSEPATEADLFFSRSLRMSAKPSAPKALSGSTIPACLCFNCRCFFTDPNASFSSIARSRYDFSVGAPSFSIGSFLEDGRRQKTPSHGLRVNVPASGSYTPTAHRAKGAASSTAAYVAKDVWAWRRRRLFAASSTESARSSTTLEQPAGHFTIEGRLPSSLTTTRTDLAIATKVPFRPCLEALRGAAVCLSFVYR